MPGGNSAYERGGDAHLAQGYKFRILVSLRVFWAKRHHIQPQRSRLGLHAKKYKNMCIVCVLTWSLLGVKKSLGYAQIGLFQGFYSNFPTSIPTPFICRVPPGATCNIGQQCLSFCRGLTVNMAVKVMVAIIQRDYLNKCFTTDVSFRYVLN